TRQPGVTDHEKGSAICILEGTTVGCVAQKSPAHRICLNVLCSPCLCKQAALLPIESPVIRLIRSADPAPLPRMGCHQAHFEAVVSIPEPLNALGKSRSLQINPTAHINVGIFIVFLRFKGEFHGFPDSP